MLQIRAKWIAIVCLASSVGCGTMSKNRDESLRPSVTQQKEQLRPYEIVVREQQNEKKLLGPETRKFEVVTQLYTSLIRSKAFKTLHSQGRASVSDNLSPGGRFVLLLTPNAARRLRELARHVNHADARIFLRLSKRSTGTFASPKI